MATYDAMKDIQGFFRDGERELIYNRCVSQRDKVLIRLLWKTGRRIGEILAVKVNEIDFENYNILWHIEKKKQKVGTNPETNRPIFKKRDLVVWKPIDKKTIDLIIDYITEESLMPESHLFSSPFMPERPITRQRAFQIVRELCKKAGIIWVGTKHPHPHHFRHSFAAEISKKLKSPSDIRKLQMIMEHSNVSTTENYLQFGNEELRELIED